MKKKNEIPSNLNLNIVFCDVLLKSFLNEWFIHKLKKMHFNHLRYSLKKKKLQNKFLIKYSVLFQAPL